MRRTKNTQRKTVGRHVSAGLLTVALTGLAAGSLTAQEQFPGASELFIQETGTMVSFAGGSAKAGGSLTVTIDGPGGVNVLDAHSKVGLIDWAVTSDLPDGVYNYSAWFTPEGAQSTKGLSPAEVTASASIEKQAAPELNTLYKSGSFRVEGGVIQSFSQPDADAGLEISGSGQQASGPERFVAAVLDFLIPEANAGTCSTPCAVGTGESQVTLIPSTGSSWEIETQSDGAQIRIGADGGSAEMWRLEAGAPSNSFFMESTGDIGLGTNAPATQLQLNNTFPNISLVDTDNGNKDYELLNNGGFFFILDRSNGSNPFVINSNSPSQSIQITPDGVGFGTASPFEEITVNGTIGFENGTTPMLMLQETCCLGGDRMIMAHSPSFAEWGIRYEESPDEIHFQRTDADRFVTVDFGSRSLGVGTQEPGAPLHVQRSNGSANVLVEDTGTTSPLQMFTLRNNGFPRFTLSDTSTGEAWDFRLSGGKFTITRVGTGGPEFEVFNNGNAELRGTLTEGSSRAIKDNIVEVDEATVLNKLESLAISEWSYTGNTEDRHVGPMAEDFYATFGLGPDNKHIAPKDLAGVALVAAKALKADNEAKDQRIAELEARLERLEALIQSD